MVPDKSDCFGRVDQKERTVEDSFGSGLCGEQKKMGDTMDPGKASSNLCL
jgi:hypothetical protein